MIATQDDLNGYSILQSVPAAEKKASAVFFGASTFRTCMVFVHIAQAVVESCAMVEILDKAMGAMCGMAVGAFVASGRLFLKF